MGISRPHFIPLRSIPLQLFMVCYARVHYDGGEWRVKRAGAGRCEKEIVKNTKHKLQNAKAMRWGGEGSEWMNSLALSLCCSGFVIRLMLALQDEPYSTNIRRMFGTVGIVPIVDLCLDTSSNLVRD